MPFLFEGGRLWRQPAVLWSAAWVRVRSIHCHAAARTAAALRGATQGTTDCRIISSANCQRFALSEPFTLFAVYCGNPCNTGLKAYSHVLPPAVCLFFYSRFFLIPSLFCCRIGCTCRGVRRSCLMRKKRTDWTVLCSGLGCLCVSPSFCLLKRFGSTRIHRISLVSLASLKATQSHTFPFPCLSLSPVSSSSVSVSCALLGFFFR